MRHPIEKTDWEFQGMTKDQRGVSQTKCVCVCVGGGGGGGGRGTITQYPAITT